MSAINMKPIAISTQLFIHFIWIKLLGARIEFQKNLCIALYLYSSENWTQCKYLEGWIAPRMSIVFNRIYVPGHTKIQ